MLLPASLNDTIGLTVYYVCDEETYVLCRKRYRTSEEAVQVADSGGRLAFICCFWHEYKFYAAGGYPNAQRP